MNPETVEKIAYLLYPCYSIKIVKPGWAAALPTVSTRLMTPGPRYPAGTFALICSKPG